MNPIIQKVIKDKYGKQTAETYDQLAYDFFWGYADSLRAAAFYIFYSKLKSLQASEELNLLDLGAGTGNFTLEILKVCNNFSQLKGSIPQNWQQNLKLTLQDRSPEMLERAKQKINEGYQSPLTLVQNDMSGFLQGDQKYDVVYSSFAIHHLSPEQKQNLFSQICARLKPKGMFVLVDRMKGHDDEEDRRFLFSVSSPFFASVGSQVNPDELLAIIQKQFDEDMDRPSTLTEQMGWFFASQYRKVRIIYQSGPVAVLVGKI